MRVEYDHYSKMCRSNKIPPLAAKDLPTYIEEVEARLKSMEDAMLNRRSERKKQQVFCLKLYILHQIQKQMIKFRNNC
jgi:hypothetical protein